MRCFRPMRVLLAAAVCVMTSKGLPLERVVAFFPSPPCHSFGIDLTWKVQAIQIGGVTIFVPPGASIIYGTVGRILVVITIPGTECHTTVRS